MTRSKVIILNLKGLYNVLLELKDFFKFELFYQEKEVDLSDQNKGKNYLVISNKKILSNIANLNFSSWEVAILKNQAKTALLRL